MEKQEIDFNIDYDLDWNYEVEIEQLKKDISELEKLGTTHVMIYSYSVYDSTCTEIRPIQRRIETDEESLIRKSEEEKRDEEKKKSELEQYNIIKKKYNL